VMKGKSLFGMAAAVALATAMISCGGGSNTSSEAPAATPAASAGKPVDASTAGSVKGTIKLDGTAPKMKVINMAAEPVCAKVHAGDPAMTQDVVTGSGGSLANVIVYLQGDFSAYSFPPATTPVTIDQKGCQYNPHVLALMIGQPLEVTNSDMTTHNIHPVPKDNREWNESQPPGSAPIMQSFAREEVAIPVKCNVHPWMKGYIGVMASPYFQVTGKDGSFDLTNVPPGTYMLTAWQELYGTTNMMVTVGPKEDKSVDLTFKATAGAD
jgi:plastocyanin